MTVEEHDEAAPETPTSHDHEVYTPLSREAHNPLVLQAEWKD